MALLSAATTARMLIIALASSGKTSARMRLFAEQIIGRRMALPSNR